MKSDDLLRQLNQSLEQLAARVAPVAMHRSRQARFDSQLFHCHSTRLSDYLLELQKNHQQLQESVRENNTERVRWLAERVVSQMAALQRELATETLRSKEQPEAPAKKSRYESLAEHQDFERRLQAMVADRESLLGQQTTLPQQKKLQQEIAALEGRLQRCRQALKRIEREIEQGERG